MNELTMKNIEERAKKARAAFEEVLCPRAFPAPKNSEEEKDAETYWAEINRRMIISHSVAALLQKVEVYRLESARPNINVVRILVDDHICTARREGISFPDMVILTTAGVKGGFTVVRRDSAARIGASHPPW